jgi:hypothetical protein
LIGSANVATACCDDVDEAMEKCKASVLMLDRHSKVGPEELSRIWNIGLETVKATLDVMTQHGVQTVVHPMLRRLRVARSLTLTQAKVERDVVFGYFNCKGKVIAW